MYSYAKLDNDIEMFGQSQVKHIAKGTFDSMLHASAEINKIC